MKLLFIVHQFLPRHVTGTEQYVRSLARGLVARGHEVSVLAFEPVLNLDAPGKAFIERDEVVDTIPVRRVGIHLELLPNRQLADYDNPLAVGFLRRYLDDHDFELAHVFHLRYLGIGALHELSVAGLPIVVNLMDFWFMCPNHTLLRTDGALCDGPPEDGLGCVDCVMQDIGDLFERVRLRDSLRAHGAAAPPPPDLHQTPVRRARALVGRKERLFAVLAGVDAIIAPSKFLRSMFEANGFARGVMRHVPYGVDEGRFGGRSKVWGTALRETLAVGYVGSLTEHKGLHHLIEALRQIDGEVWHLHVHGSLETHPEFSDRLQALASNDPRITFHGPFEPSDLGQVLERLDLIAVPSIWYENTPFSVLEAQMMALPVLASDLGGISESVEHGVNGFLFPAGDVKALTRVLREILADVDQLPKMRLGGDVRTLAANLDDFEGLYRELLGMPASFGSADDVRTETSIDPTPTVDPDAAAR